MTEEPDQERLRQLEERLSRMKRDKAPVARKEQGDFTQGEVAWRMVIEMVSGLLIGFGIGYGLDYLFGTRPILLVIFTLLGLVAGVKTMLGTAAELNAKTGQAPASRDDEGN
ncbi:F0F1 ATP synthase subunit I [Haematobacter massiliensis]|uniref:ATP synthase protein I n=1 Tax=Haematobacter massiliensis TaxID=195105 RepID=A0A086YCE2_9RHOB|nr:AtpZ/AtpI family protein [Haematobacter massiliensis]KFI31942.1 ATP synthase F0 subunit I [Haematobacter massiliensis]OWJ72557.1 F0F1 ATP synthase subunit I [Haematobacter massiliensis]OWJ87895.1 F0F1 ATP synthase subunit I [Haematobacter massiliensis]QBJ24334.1 F0F1 ATP synthase subunit I [Haematobacter massiliensis]